MALKTVFEYCFNAIEFYPKSNRFVLASRRKSNHFVLKIRLGGFADYRYCPLIPTDSGKERVGLGNKSNRF